MEGTCPSALDLFSDRIQRVCVCVCLLLGSITQFLVERGLLGGYAGQEIEVWRLEIEGICKVS